MAEDETRPGFLLRFTNTHRGLSTNIVGTRNHDHLRENVEAAARGPLPDNIYEEVKRRLDAAVKITS